VNKENNREPPQHNGSVVPEDAELTLWLNRLWARDEPPNRIELWQVFRRNVRGEMIFHEDFKPGEKFNIEEVNRLASELMMAAQNDADSVRKEALYQIAVIDKNRRASPLTRLLGPIQPKRSYALARAGANTNVDDDDDSPRDAAALNLAHTREGLEQQRWDKQRYDKVMGEMILLLHTTVKDQQVVIDRFFNQHLLMFEKMQEAEDRRLDRDTVREKEKFKIDLMKDGLRTARNLLPGFFGGGNTPAPPDKTNGSTADNGHANGKDHGASPERALVDNFLTDCEGVGADLALFGEFEEVDDKWVQTKPGIFTIRQFGILVGVRDGRLPVSALDPLMPQSGHKNAITPDQITRAGEAGVTEGIAMALLELMGLRNRAKEAFAAQNESPDQPGE
jgi:hypothetical protein